MAFGDLKGTLSGSLTSITTSTTISTGGPITVAVGDLIYALIAEQTTATVTGCADSLGNTYKALVAADAGTTVTGRVFWSRVTVAGSLSSVTFAATASNNNVVGLAAVIAGPFLAVPKQAFYTLDTMAGNLRFAQGDRLVASVANFGIAGGLISRSAGKVYCEFTLTHGAAVDSIAFGIIKSAFTASYTPGTTFLGIAGNNSLGWGYLGGSAPVYLNGSAITTIQSFVQGDVACMAVDLDNRRIWFRTNGGNWNNSGTANPATNVGGIDFSAMVGAVFPAVENDLAGDVITANFGQSAYSQTVPAGFENWDTPLDKNPANVLNDNTTPFIGPPTGTLSETEVVMCWAVQTGNVTLTATSPNTKSIQLNTANVLTAALGRQVVATSGSATPAWTSSGTPTESAYGTSSFRQELSQTVSVAGAISDADTVPAPVVAGTALPSSATIMGVITSVSYRYRFKPEASVIVPFILPVPSGISPALFSDSDSVFAPVVGGSYTVSPTKLSDSDTLFAPVVTSIVLPAALFSDSDTVFSVSVGAGAAPITPTLFTDSDALFSPLVVGGIPQLFEAYSYSALLIKRGTPLQAQVIDYAVQLSRAITLGTISDLDSFYGPSVVGGVAPQLFAGYTYTSPLVIQRVLFADPFTIDVRSADNRISPALIADADTLFNPSFTGEIYLSQRYSGIGEGPQSRERFVPSSTIVNVIRIELTQNITPARLNDADSLRAPALVGLGNVAPGLFTDSDTLFSPFIAGAVFPSKFTDSDSLFAPVTLSIYTVTPGLLADLDNFFFSIPTITQTTFPALFIDSDTVFSPVVLAGLVFILPGQISDSDLLFQPAVSGAAASIVAGIFTDTDVFFSPSIDTSASTVTPTLFTDSDALFAPALSSAVSIAPSLFTDADAFFAPSAAAVGAILPGLFTDVDVLFTPSVVPGFVTVSPGRISDADLLFAPLGIGANIAAGLFGDSDVMFNPSLVIGAAVVSPSTILDVDALFGPQASLAIQNVFPQLYEDGDRLFSCGVSLEPNYDFPIGKSLTSDYGLRQSRLRRGKYIIGRR